MNSTVVPVATDGTAASSPNAGSSFAPMKPSFAQTRAKLQQAAKYVSMTKTSVSSLASDEGDAPRQRQHSSQTAAGDPDAPDRPISPIIDFEGLRHTQSDIQRGNSKRISIGSSLPSFRFSKSRTVSPSQQQQQQQQQQASSGTTTPTKRRKRRPSTIGDRANKLLRKEVGVVGAESTFGRRFDLLRQLLRWSWGKVGAFMLAIYLVAALAMSLLNWAGGCDARMYSTPDSQWDYGKLYLLELALLFGGQGLVGGGMDVNKASHLCLALPSVSVAVGLLLGSLVFSIVVRRVMKPRAFLLFSRNLVTNRRNGKIVMQARLFNGHHNLIVKPVVTATWMCPSKSREGESYVDARPVKFTHPPFIYPPISVSHLVDDSSPFKGADPKNCRGLLCMTVTGHDTVLDTEVRCIHFYMLRRDVLTDRRFKDVVVRSFITCAMKNEGLPIVDVAAFDETVPVKHSKLDAMVQKVEQQGASSPKAGLGSSGPVVAAGGGAGAGAGAGAAAAASVALAGMARGRADVGKLPSHAEEEEEGEREEKRRQESE